MDEQDNITETQEQIEERRRMSESLYERDKAYQLSNDAWRCREGKGWCGGF